MRSIEGVTVVIPNYNGEILLPQTIPLAIIALEQTGLAYEIIVVDDASTDKSLEMLKQHFSTVKCIVSEKNNGFSITANKGVKAALYDWVLLLNSDVKLEPDYFITLLKYTSYPQLFAVMGRIVGWQDEVIQDGAKYPSFHGVKIKTAGNYLLKDEKKMENGIFSMYVSGANAFFNKHIFIKIGGFNELFSPFYVEDFELSLRAWRAGYECYYEHNAICRHQVSTTILAKNKKKDINIIYYRNKLFLHYIHLTGVNLVIWFFQLVPETLFSLFTGKFYFIKSLYLFFKNLGKASQSKQQLSKLIKKGQDLLSVKQVANTILSSLKYKEIQRF